MKSITQLSETKQQRVLAPQLREAMAKSTIIRKTIGAVKDQTSIGLAKVGSSNSLVDLEVAIVKSTRHEEQPAEEKHIREILSLTSYSRANVSACVNALSRRLNKTKNWTVALKTLILIYRLLSDGDHSYEKEIFFATRRGTRLLNMSDFRDTSTSNSWDYSAFVRTFALYLDERLEFRMHRRRHRRGSLMRDPYDEEGLEGCVQPARGKSTPVREMKTDRILSRMHYLQQLLERFVACRPTGWAKNNRIVVGALYPLVKESFQLYYDIAEIMGILIDRFMEMDIPTCGKVFDIFSRISKQFEELEAFYGWCKAVGIARSSEYPKVEKITQKKLDVMDEFIRDKATLAQSQKVRNQEQNKNKVLDVQPYVQEPREEDQLNGIKALPPADSSTLCQQEAEEEDIKEETNNEKILQEEELLDLSDSLEMSKEEQGRKLALALFDGQPAVWMPWEAFDANEEPADWERALVVSASKRSDQNLSLGGGFNMLLLNGMYQHYHASTPAAVGTGIASSVAFPTTTVQQGKLALPATTGVRVGGDPFAASAVIPPPAYVQMSEMEKMQRLLVEEKLMWEQYARDGMQVHFPAARPTSGNGF